MAKPVVAHHLNQFFFGFTLADNGLKLHFCKYKRRKGKRSFGFGFVLLWKRIIVSHYNLPVISSLIGVTLLGK